MEHVKTVSAAKTFGVLAEFASVADVAHAAEKVRDRGFKRWDVYSPFPIHGIERAMGIGDSKLGWIAFFMAVAGATGGFGLQYWVTNYAYPLLIGGKPMNSYPAYVPVTFEPGILFTGFGCILGMLILNGLPRWYHSVFKSQNFKKVTDNGFFIAIEAKDPKFNLEDTRRFLESIGGRNIEVLED
jgi:Protein of unknown function (DUF3341)